MNIPCSTPPLDCPSDEALIPNNSAELPDRRLYFAYRYFLDYSTVCQSVTPIVGGYCVPSSGLYSSNAQTCTIDCSGSPLSYVAPSGAALGLTQAEADAAAYALACLGAEIVCDGGSGLLISNEVQSCTVPCADGSTIVGTIPAGSVFAFSLAEANAAAFVLACQSATAQCPDNPPPLYGNTAVSSTSDCPSGGSFTYLVPANTFFAATLSEANASAQSYADQQAVLQRICLSDIQGAICKDEHYNAVILAGSEPSTDFTWSIIAGSIPPFYTFVGGFLDGDSFTSGTYSFTIRAVQNSTGNYCTRTYTIGIMEITTAATLPSGSTGVAYSQALAYVGVPSTAVFSLAYGTTPPAGLSLSAAGLISGTPTASGSTNFSVIIADSSSGFTCVKDFTMSVTLNPLDWWKMDEAANGTRFGSVNGIPLICSANVSSVAGGKYGNATELNSTQPGPSSSCGNTALPVTGLLYAGNGIDVFVWIHIPAVPSSDTILLLNFCDSSGATVWSLSFTVDNLVGIEYQAGGTSSGVFAMATSANYRLFELFYNPATNIVGVRVDNGSFFGSNTAVPSTLPATAKGSISITYNRKSAGSSAAEVCEMAVYPAILDAAQRAYIYNANLGRTWPVVLP